MLDIAIKYTRRGMRVVPVPFRSKNPNRRGWQRWRFDEGDLPAHFGHKPQNIGVLTGEPSGWIIDVDLDHSIALELADEYLPPTPAVFGRCSKPRSHRIYRTTGPVETKKYKSKIHGMLVELRSTGCQTVFPPSTHEEGEAIEWEVPDAEPAVIDPRVIFEAVERLASAVFTRLGEEPRKGREKPPKNEATNRDRPARGDNAIEKCLASMQRMKLVDHQDGSHRLFAAACRIVEWDLDDTMALACIRRYAVTAPFPREWTDDEIVARIRDAEKTCERGKACEEPENDDDNKRQSQATQLVALCSDLEFFHDDDVAYTTLTIHGHAETLRVRSSQFRSWLARRFYQEHHKAPGGQGLADAIGVLEGQARFEGPEIKVHVRIAEHDGAIYLDLADTARDVVRVATTGWTVTTEAPVKFRRPKGLRALPVPVQGGSLRTLREYINLDRDADFVLLVAWLVAVIRPGRSTPVLIFSSEQGSGKSTASRLLRLLIDPNEAPIRCQPREPRDLMIAANNSIMVALDNLSDVPIWLSDAICRLSTGGALSTRTLYENDEETLFNALRPVILNGIDDLGSRSDLLDRAIRIALPTIPEERRRPEREIYERFEQDRPGMLGAVLDAACEALRSIAQTRIERSPRMADFAQWIVAAEPALPWARGAFLKAYDENRHSAHDIALEAEPVSEAVIRFAQEQTEWMGSPTELLTALSATAGDNLRMQPGWPKRANALTAALKRITPNLRALGVSVEFPKRTGKRRTISVRNVPQTVVTSVTDRHEGNSDDATACRGDDRDWDDDDAVTIDAATNRLAVTIDDDCDGLSLPSSNLDDDLEERMAIMEYEGGMNRSLAESRARAFCNGYRREVA